MAGAATSNRDPGADPMAVLRMPPLGDAEFRFISGFVGRHCGIVLGAQKRQLVQGRLARRLRELGLADWRAYCARLEQQPDAEIDALVSAISTNVTAFFREQHHFEFLRDEVLPALLVRPGAPRLRLWSAGCATGEEPYTLAMVLAEVLERHGKPVDARILATDLSPQALTTAQHGVYRADHVAGIDPARRKRWFEAGSGARTGDLAVRPELRELIAFRRLNLLDDWPMQGRFDAIFCRNVVIYFDKPTKVRLFSRFADQMTGKGHLFLGHSESMFGLSEAFALVGRTIYRREGGS